MRFFSVLIALLCVFLALPVQAAKSQSFEVHGQPDRNVPGWTLRSAAPPGWTGDCCMYAKAIGVDYVIYQGDWTGNPDRVMVLNVWPSKLATLDDEWQADRKSYLKRDPNAKVTTLAISNPAGMICHGLLYEGSDHVEDAVVFCDPGAKASVRLSWSVTITASDPLRDSVLASLKQVIEQSRYEKYVPTTSSMRPMAVH